MKDIIQLVCAVIGFVFTIAIELCVAIWLCNIGPITIDKKPAWCTTSLLPGYPVINNISLILLFALQHSLMARKMLKTIITVCLPGGFERIIYNMATVVFISLMCLLWEPLPTHIWNITTPWLRYSVIAVRVTILVLMLKAVRAMDRHVLYGIREPLSRLRNEKQSKAQLITVGAYGVVRHPMMSCLIGMFFVTPTMSVGHLLFSVSMTAYIIPSVLYLEEPDLVEEMGPQYQEYRKTTPAFIPYLWKPKPAQE